MQPSRVLCPISLTFLHLCPVRENPNMSSTPEIDVTNAVGSSNIKWFAYHYARSVLIIRFLDGAIWEYENVPSSVYESMKQAPSVGKYVYGNIRNVFAGNAVTDDRYDSLSDDCQRE